KSTWAASWSRSQRRLRYRPGGHTDARHVAHLTRASHQVGRKALTSRGLPGEELPAPHDDIDISWIELEAMAGAAGHHGRYQGRAQARCCCRSSTVQNGVSSLTTTPKQIGFGTEEGPEGIKADLGNYDWLAA